MVAERDRLKQMIAVVYMGREDGSADETIVRVTRVVWLNVTRGRVEAFLGAGRERNLEAYIQRVVDNYCQHHARVEGLQRDRDSALWDPFYQEIQSWVYDYLLGHGFVPNEGTFRLVENYSSFAVEQLLRAHFPYDIQFERWARTVVQNVCRKQMTRDTRLKHIPDKLLVGLEQWQPGAPRTASARRPQEELLVNIDLRDELQAILQKLPASCRVVIQLRYFAGMDYPDIAAALDRTTKAVYNLHFKAIKRLREILTVNGYSIQHGSKQSIRRSSRQFGASPRPTDPDEAK